MSGGEAGRRRDREGPELPAPRPPGQQSVCVVKSQFERPSAGGPVDANHAVRGAPWWWAVRPAPSHVGVPRVIRADCTGLGKRVTPVGWGKWEGIQGNREKRVQKEEGVF